MTPRRRSIPDAAITAHACQLLIERGRAGVSFAQVAERCGLAPPTLVQRFGTLDGLLKAAAAHFRLELAAALATPPTVGTRLDNLRSQIQSQAPLIGAALELSRFADLAPFALELRKQISFALAAAADAGELPHCDIAALARTLQIAVVGAVAVASLEGGNAADEVGRVIDAQLATYV